MQTLKFTIVLCAIGIVFTACKDEKTQTAIGEVEAFSSYVDSIANLDYAEANSNWERIEKGYKSTKSTAKINLNQIKENGNLKSDIDDASQKFENYKVDLAENKLVEIQKQKNNFRIALLGENYLNDDMKFEWINKNNILGVYQNFVDTAEANKESYLREEWDEIKLLYEAIDNRKNTAENEGLTSSDNRKIAALKLKFAPMYTFYRMGAKSEENAKAKQ